MFVLWASLLVFVESSHQMDCTAAAHLGRWWINGCSERCVCEQVASEYVWTCYRERKEFTCMSSADRKLWFDTYKAISTPGHPQYNQYKLLIARHDANFGSIHQTAFFLPWHRWFQMAMEDLLRTVNCKVTMPWWDTAKNAGAPWLVSPWGAATDLMGTKGGACVTDGGFASPGWPNNAHGCLKRVMSGTLPSAADESTVLALPSSGYNTFSDTLQTSLHNIIHVRIGGTMAQGYSPEAPEFFLHHGNVDRLWDVWQRKSAAHLNAYSHPLNAVMPVAMGATPAMFNDLKKTKVMYVRSASSTLGSGHLVLASCNLIKILGASFDLSKVQLAIQSASSAQLALIPRLAAPVLTDNEQAIVLSWTRRAGTPAQVEMTQSKLNAAKARGQKTNEALKSVGMLRERFPDAVSQALGFDAAKAVEVLKVRPEEGQIRPTAKSPTPRTVGTAPTGRTIATAPGRTVATATNQPQCARGTVYCLPQKKCLAVSAKCVPA